MSAMKRKRFIYAALVGVGSKEDPEAGQPR